MKLIVALASVWERASRPVPRLRALLLYLYTGARFKSVGRAAKVRGAAAISIGAGVSIGDFCWIEAVRLYRGMHYEPRLTFHDRVAMSDFVHISCAQSITLGEDCLLGSKVYIGDHNHGNVRDLEQIATVAPAARPLGDFDDISIGARTWIGDGAVILAGTALAPGSIVGANSVVKLKLDRPALLAGVPARVIRYFDEKDCFIQDEVISS